MKDIEDIAKEKYPDTIFPKENDIEISPRWVLVNLREAFISGSQYGKEWVSVETELPDCGRYNATYFNPNDSIRKMYVITAWRGRDGWYWDNEEKERAEDSTLKITHWMPFPKPPKSGEDKVN